MSAQPEFQQRLQSMERLLQQLDAAADPNLRATARDLIQLVMELHGQGLERIVELVRNSEDGETLVLKLGRDDLVSNLLVLYGLHPVDLEARVAQALENARLRLRAQESDIEMLSIQEGAVRLRLHSSSHACGSSPEALREIVETAIYRAAPDIATLTIEGAASKHDFVPIQMLQGVAP